MLREVASTVSTAAFSSVCSASMMPETDTAKPPPRRSERSLVRRRLLHALGARPGERRVGLVDGDRRAPRAGSGCRALARRARANAPGTTTSETNGAAAMPERDRRLPAGDPERDREREADARQRLHQHQPAEQPEALWPASQPRAK